MALSISRKRRKRARKRARSRNALTKRQNKLNLQNYISMDNDTNQIKNPHKRKENVCDPYSFHPE